MPQAEIDAANPVASSVAVTGAGGIPTGGTFEVLKASQAGQTGAGGGFSAFQAQTSAPEKREAGKGAASQPASAPSWTPPPAMTHGTGWDSIAPALPASATTQGAATAAPAASAPPAAAPGATMAAGLATVVAKMDALLSALKDESGFLQKVLS